MKPLIELRSLTYTQPGTARPLFENFDAGFSVGECHVLLGRSGGGKSTLLRLIAGLLKPETGQVIVNAEKEPGWQQFLFQDYDCFPWMTVFDNVRKCSGPPEYPDEKEVEAILRRVGLGDKKDFYPGALSGGMRKRLGFARTLVRKPKLLLLDEPFASLDIALRSEMYKLLQELIAEHGTTVILVSHDLHEAITLGDQIYILGDCPAKIVSHISNPFAHPRTEEIVQSQFYSEAHRLIIDQLNKG